MKVKRLQDQLGFTLVELLVVVLIIGVLCSIAIPTFLRQREKGWQAAAVTDMKNAATGIETFAVDHNGSFAGADGATQSSPILLDSGFRSTDWVDVRVSSSDDSYCIEGSTVNLPGKTFVYRSDDGVVTVVLTGEATC